MAIEQERRGRGHQAPDFRSAFVRALLGALAAACSPVPSGPPSVVMIVLDTTRPDLTSAYGFEGETTPFLESLAAAGTRFDRAYSSSSWTLPAHGTLFTGVRPRVHRANQTHLRVDESLPLLAGELSRAGYQTAGFTGNVWLTDRSGLDVGFEYFRDLNRGVYRPRIERLAADPSGAATAPEEHYVAREVLAWLRQGREAERPFFLFVNLVDPHLPYLPYWEAVEGFLGTPEQRWQAIQEHYPGGQETSLIRRHYRGTRPLGDAEWDTIRRMYLGTLRVVDDVARAIVAAVDEVSDPRNTLCFVLSDHGENLGDHGHFTHIMNLYDSNLRIVLLARGPGFAPGHVEQRLVGIQDLYPTVMRAAGLPPGEHVEGVDLRDDIPRDRILSAALEYPRLSLQVFRANQVRAGRYARYERELEAAIGPRFKLIRSTDSGSGEVGEEFFDLLSDPDERHPLTAAQVGPATASKLRAAVTASRAGAAADPSPEGTPWDSGEAIEELRAMGYVGEDD